MSRSGEVFWLRDEQEGDVFFLERLYASTRQEELAQSGWDAATRETFLASQFRAQREHYRRQYAKDQFQIIVQGQEPIGRLYVGRWRDEIRVIDIALLPQWRGRGIGTSLLRDVMREAALRRVPVRIHVETFNPARKLYERLGFVTIEDKGVYLLQEWRDVR